MKSILVAVITLSVLILTTPEKEEKIFVVKTFVPKKVAVRLEEDKEIFQVTCNVNRGSGVVFKEGDDKFWIFTAAHCVEKDGKETPTTVIFFTNGFKSHKMKAKVEWYEYVKGTTTDIAVVTVKISEFKNYPFPQTIPLADKDTKMKVNDVVYSCGFPTEWPTAWKGHLKEVHQDRVMFVPVALPGRSGSGLFDVAMSRILGIVIWQNGSAVSVRKIHSLMEKHDGDKVGEKGQEGHTSLGTNHKGSGR